MAHSTHNHLKQSCEDENGSIKPNFSVLPSPSVPESEDVIFAFNFDVDPPPIISRESLRTGRPLGCGIVQISEDTVVKFGEHVTLSEAETMHLLSIKAPDVPIPSLRNAYSIAGVGYIVMEFIDETPLAECWTAMTKADKQRIVQQLQQYVSTWRAVEGKLFGAVDGGPCKERLFSHVYENLPKVYGPFSNRLDYNHGIVKAFRDSRPSHVDPDLAIESQILQKGGDRMILTHGDLHQRNILVGRDMNIKAILDWGESCFSVEEMEYCCARWGSKDEEWQESIPNFIPGCEEDFRFWNNINEEMRVYVGI